MVKSIRLILAGVMLTCILVLIFQIKMTLKCRKNNSGSYKIRSTEENFRNGLNKTPVLKYEGHGYFGRSDDTYITLEAQNHDRIGHPNNDLYDMEQNREAKAQKQDGEHMNNDGTVIHNNDSIIVNCVTGAIMRTISTDQQEYVPLKESIKDIDAHKYDIIRKSKFVEIFKNGSWGREEDNTLLQRSGPGSRLENAQEIMAVLHTLINEIKRVKNIQKVNLVDIPCGDMQWMAKFLKTRDDVIYTGIDIVPNLIDHQKTKYFNTKWEFIQSDIATTPLRKSYDLILCRMMLQHLALKSVLKVLHNFSHSNSSFLLTTTYPTCRENKDITPGEYQRLNLEISPIGLKPPLCYHRDEDGPGGHYIGLWKLPLQTFRLCPVQKHILQDKISLKMYSCSMNKKLSHT